MLKTSFLTFLIYWLTVSRVRAAIIVHSALVVTLAMLLRLIPVICFIIIIIIIFLEPECIPVRTEKKRNSNYELSKCSLLKHI